MSVMNVRRRVPPATAFAAAAALALTALTACSVPAAATTTSDGRLKVTASFYPLEFLVRQIGGPHVAVTDLTRPGVEPHDLELSPARSPGSAAQDSRCICTACSPRWTRRSSSPG